MTSRWRSSRFWIRAVGLLVVMSLALSLAHLTWRLAGLDDGRDRIQTPDRLAPLGGGGGALAAVTALAPFGGAAVAADGLPETQLGMTLKGVIYAADPAQSSVLISVAGAPPQTFGLGEAPVGNATIQAIEMDRVVLDIAGRREALSFPRTDAVAGPAPSAPSSPAPVAPTALPTASPEAAAALAAASPIATAMAAQRRNAPPPRAAAPANPVAAMSAAGVSVTSQGYRLGPDTPDQLRRAGLQPGDLIRSLNGQPVGDLKNDQQLFERAAAAGSARVEIVRDGRTLTLTFPLR